MRSVKNKVEFKKKKLIWDVGPKITFWRENKIEINQTREAETIMEKLDEIEVIDKMEEIDETGKN